MGQLTSEDHKRVQALLNDLVQFGIEIQRKEVHKDPAVRLTLEGTIPPDRIEEINDGQIDDVINKLERIALQHGVPKGTNDSFDHPDNPDRVRLNWIVDN